MGCVSSKLFRRELEKERTLNNGGDNYPNHVVSLTSSTYGALSLEKRHQNQISAAGDGGDGENGEKKVLKRSPTKEKPEEINAWELMEGLEEDADVAAAPAKKSPRSMGILLKGFGDIDRSPLKFLNQIGSPRKAKSVGGKENQNPKPNNSNRRPEFCTPVRTSGEKLGRNAAMSLKFGSGSRRESSTKPEYCTPARNNGEQSNHKAVMSLKFGSGSRRESSSKTEHCTPARNSSEKPNHKAVLSLKFGTGSRRESSGDPASPLFDPDLVASYEKELSLQGEEIKRMVSPAKKNSSSPENCPPGGENAVVIYTTTLRGIRKTFEECNKVRTIVESHLVQVAERDVSMDSGFREELRRLTGTKQIKVPVVYVRGRLVGGAEEVARLEEEGKLGILLEGLPSAFSGGCGGCAGFRFVMCVRCSGSCRVLDEMQGKMVRCGACNENGLVRCRVCCSLL